MIRYTLPLLLPFAALADTPPEEILDFAAAHCLRIDAPATFYDLPDGWEAASKEVTNFWLPTKAIEKGMEYAAFITYQSEVAQEVDPASAWPRTIEKFEDQLSEERSYALDYEWTRLFIHNETGAFLMVAAGEDVDNIDALHDPTCHLWHPEGNHPLNTAIIARWDVPYGHRFVSGMGQTNRAWNHVTINGERRILETRVMRPEIAFREGLAPVVLKLEVTSW